jgi:hypothetical protein
MKSLALPIAISTTGGVIALVSTLLLVLPAGAAYTPARGGHATLPRTTNAPHPSKRVRGVMRTVPAVLVSTANGGVAYVKP